jgi:NAD(P)-dependent dehydrogenase (short-subunit alcohol dehydrogenase family)
MTRILVTGGNGGLGRVVARQLGHAGYTVRVMSCRPAPNTAPAFEWAQADIETGAMAPSPGPNGCRRPMRRPKW